MEEIFGSEERGAMKMRDERIERESGRKRKRMTEDKNERKYVG